MSQKLQLCLSAESDDLGGESDDLGAEADDLGGEQMICSPRAGVVLFELHNCTLVI